MVHELNAAILCGLIRNTNRANIALIMDSPWLWVRTSSTYFIIYKLNQVATFFTNENNISEGERLHSVYPSICFYLFPVRCECIQRKSSAESLIFSADVTPLQAANHMSGT